MPDDAKTFLAFCAGVSMMLVAAGVLFWLLSLAS